MQDKKQRDNLVDKVLHAVDQRGRLQFGKVHSTYISQEQFVALPHPIKHLIEDLAKRLLDTETLVTKDSLTGLHNRRAYDEEIEKVIAMAKRRHFGQKKSEILGDVVVLFDINDFKMFNSAYSHAGGDEALKHLGILLKKCLRPHDFVSRLAGDEFVVIFKDTTENLLEGHLEELRYMIDHTPFKYEGKKIHITIAYGMHQIHPEDTAQGILKIISKNMKKDKSKYKNVH